MKHFTVVNSIGCSWIPNGKYNPDVRWEYVSRKESFYYKEDIWNITPVTYVRLQ
jgi:hypothetical protein